MSFSSCPAGDSGGNDMLLNLRPMPLRTESVSVPLEEAISFSTSSSFENLSVSNIVARILPRSAVSAVRSFLNCPCASITT